MSKPENVGMSSERLARIDRFLDERYIKTGKLPCAQVKVWRGGKLAHLAPQYEAELKALRPDEDTAAWAFRFLRTIPGVTMILSGMSDQEQLEKNLATFAEDRKLNEAEMQTLLGIADQMLSVGTVPCTACHYCVSHCPMGLDIPHLLSLYNEHAYTGGGFIAPMALSALPPEKQPSACLHCRSCEQVCPQQIKISEVMADFSEKLG
jgi:predicted aldo/keto reductase-like oxidoreductase